MVGGEFVRVSQRKSLCVFALSLTQCGIWVTGHNDASFTGKDYRYGGYTFPVIPVGMPEVGK